MPAEYRKCITNIIFSFKKSEVQPQLTKKLYNNELTINEGGCVSYEELWDQGGCYLSRP